MRCCHDRGLGRGSVGSVEGDGEGLVPILDRNHGVIDGDRDVREDRKRLGRGQTRRGEGLAADRVPARDVRVRRPRRLAVRPARARSDEEDDLVRRRGRGRGGDGRKRRDRVERRDRHERHELRDRRRGDVLRDRPNGDPRRRRHRPGTSRRSSTGRSSTRSRVRTTTSGRLPRSTSTCWPRTARSLPPAHAWSSFRLSLRATWRFRALGRTPCSRQTARSDRPLAD